MQSLPAALAHQALPQPTSLDATSVWTKAIARGHGCQVKRSISGACSGARGAAVKAALRRNAGPFGSAGNDGAELCIGPRVCRGSDRNWIGEFCGVAGGCEFKTG
jgi:hypothetical protein